MDKWAFMDGTIKRNNVIGPMIHYECYKDTPQHRVEFTMVDWGGGEKGHPEKAKWAHRMTIDCCYDRFMSDERCHHKGVECKVYKNLEALERFGVDVAILRRTG